MSGREPLSKEKEKGQNMKPNEEEKDDIKVR